MTTVTTAQAHTAGPWGLNGQTIFNWASRETIASCKPIGIHNPKEVALANARLIAASPKLLEACKELVETLEQFTDEEDGEDEQLAKYRKLIAEAS